MPAPDVQPRSDRVSLERLGGAAGSAATLDVHAPDLVFLLGPTTFGRGVEHVVVAAGARRRIAEDARDHVALFIEPQPHVETVEILGRELVLVARLRSREK